MIDGGTALTRAQHHLAELERRLQRQLMILEELRQDENPCEPSWSRVVQRTRQEILASKRSLQAMEEQQALSRKTRGDKGLDSRATAPDGAGTEAPR
ncbi:hypothetical protein [Roseomonas sp. BN140053]|uniref:hypothetical protein n=1 Tax=Roseomonas sp. BN140053 TaxID=3391898 RepID=UPI0039EB2482